VSVFRSVCVGALYIQGWMSVCGGVCVCVCIIHTHTHTHRTHTGTHTTQIFICMYTYTYVCIYIHTHVCIYIHTHVCIYTRMYVCVPTAPAKSLTPRCDPKEGEASVCVCVSE